MLWWNTSALSISKNLINICSNFNHILELPQYHFFLVLRINLLYSYMTIIEWILDELRFQEVGNVVNIIECTLMLNALGNFLLSQKFPNWHGNQTCPPSSLQIMSHEANQNHQETKILQKAQSDFLSCIGHRGNPYVYVPYIYIHTIT